MVSLFSDPVLGDAWATPPPSVALLAWASQQDLVFLLAMGEASACQVNNAHFSNMLCVFTTFL